MLGALADKGAPMQVHEGAPASPSESLVRGELDRRMEAVLSVSGPSCQPFTHAEDILL